MKCLIVLILSFYMAFQTLDLDAIRSAYKEASQNNFKAEAFYSRLEKVSKNDKAELVAYKASAIALKSKQAKTLKDKKEGFMEGITLLEETIKREPNNIELRIIRLSIQENTPKLLKYKSEITSDKHFILKQYNSIKSIALKHYIKDYIVQSKEFTAEEKSVILD